MEIGVGPFLLGQPLGRGGMGTVYRGRHEASGLPVAIKVVRGSSDPRFLAAFEREVEAVAALDHPAVVRVFDHGTIGTATARASGGRLQAGVPYLAMEHAGAGSLLPASQRSWTQARATLLRILDALAHAHARGVIHRDLKPQNLLVAHRRDLYPGLKLADFGLAHPLDADGPLAAGAGTPCYMAPEQVARRWRDFGPHTDLYALGALAWELVTGLPPFTGEDVAGIVRQQLQAPVPPLRPRFGVPDGLEELLGTLLTKDPRHRPDSAAAVARSLLGLGDATGEQDFAPPHHDDRSTLLFTLVPLEGDSELTEEVPLEDAPVVGVVEPPRPAARDVGDWREREPDRPPELLGVGLGLFALRPPPFVGRDEERDRLWTELRRVCVDGTTRVVVLEGPPGVGKSRLAAWLGHRAAELGAAGVWRAAHAEGAAHQGALEAMMERVVRVVGLPPAEASARAARFGDPEEVVALATGHAADPVAVACRAIRDHAGARPLIVWLDDAHHEPAALQLAEQLLAADLASPRPVLAVLTVDSDGLVDRPLIQRAVAQLSARTGALRLAVDALDPEQIRRLVRQTLGLDLPLISRVVDRSGGNPRLALGILRDWVDRGLLVPTSTGFDLTATDVDGSPGDLREVWARRVAPTLTRMSAQGRTAAAVAAALGRAFAWSEWRAACRAFGVPPDPRALSELARRGLLVREADSGRFVDEVVRRLVLDGHETPALHLACAAAVPSEAHERLGLHLAAGGRHEQAYAPLFEGVSARMHAEDYGGGLRLLDVAASALRAAGVDAEDPRWGKLASAQVLCRYNAWDLERALEEGLTALQRAPRVEAWVPYRVRLLHGASVCAFRLGRLDEAWAWSKEALQLGPDLPMKVNLLRSLAHIAQARGELRRARRLTAAYGALAVQRGDLSMQSSAENDLGALATRLGDPAAAERHLRQAIALCEQTGDRDIVIGLCNLAGMLVGDGRDEEAHALALDALARARDGISAFHLAAATVVTLRTAVAVGDAAVWQALLPRVGPLLRAARLVDRSIAEALTECFRAMRSDDPVGSRIAGELALAQHQGLGHLDEAASITAELRGA